VGTRRKKFGAHATRLQGERHIIEETRQCVARRWSSGDEAELPQEFARYASRTLRCRSNKIDSAHTQCAAQRAREEGAEESRDRRGKRALPRTRRATD
jgi:hypothetical protein